MGNIKNGAGKERHKQPFRLFASQKSTSPYTGEAGGSTNLQPSSEEGKRWFIGTIRLPIAAAFNFRVYWVTLPIGNFTLFICGESLIRIGLDFNRLFYNLYYGGYHKGENHGGDNCNNYSVHKGNTEDYCGISVNLTVYIQRYGVNGGYQH